MTSRFDDAGGALAAALVVVSVGIPGLALGHPLAFVAAAFGAVAVALLPPKVSATRRRHRVLGAFALAIPAGILAAVSLSDIVGGWRVWVAWMSAFGVAGVALTMGAPLVPGARPAAVTTGFLAAYALYRSDLAANVPHLAVFEWVVGLAVAAFAIGRVLGSLAHDAPARAWDTTWSRHTQGVTPMYDKTFLEWQRVLEDFLARGASRDLYESLWEQAFDASGDDAGKKEALRALGALVVVPEPRVGAKRLEVQDENAARRVALHAHLVGLAKSRGAVTGTRLTVIKE